MHSRHLLKSTGQQGFAVITSLLVVLVVFVLIVGALGTAQIETFVARNDAQATQAQYVAVAGMQKYRTALFQSYRHAQTTMGGGSGAVGSCGLDFGSFRNIDWDRTGTTSSTPWQIGERVIATAGEIVTDALGNPIGSYAVDIIKDSDSIYVVESRGTSGTAAAVARAAVTIGDAGSLEQAIFAASGSDAKSINGNILIRGGVYIEGLKGDPKPVVLEAGGTFGQLNNYRMSDYGTYLEDKVDEEHHQANDLCATLRIKDGRLELTSGSVSLGESSAPFTGAEPRLTGVFVDEGTQDIIAKSGLYDNKTGDFKCNNAGGLCANEIGAFDIDRATAPSFPRLHQVEVTPGCSMTGSPTWRECIDDDALNEGVVVNSATASGFGASCSAAFSGATLTLDADNVECMDSSGMYGFRYTAATGLLEVYGTVNLEGVDLVANRDLQFRARQSTGAGALKNAVLFVEESGGVGGSISVDGSLLPDDTATFPEQVLGVLAENNVTFSKQTNVMAPIYAGDTFRITQQSTIFGSVLADSFCTTSAGGSECNAGQSVEVVHITTRDNRPKALGYVYGGSGLATFISLGVEVN